MKLKRIGLCLLLDFSWNREILPGIARYARNQGDWQVTAWRNLKDFNLDNPPDGIIGIFQKQDSALAEFAKRGVKFVGVSGFDPPAGIPLVTHDDRAIGRMAAQHLVEKKLRRFACLNIGRATNANLRMQGFCDELQRLGMPPPVVWDDDPIDLMERIINVSKPIGVFAVNDRRALHAEQCAHACGFSVPTDIAILGVDNDIVDCELCAVPLSSIVPQFEQIGWHAAQLLDRLMHGESVDDIPLRLQPLKVEVRQSTEYLLVEDPLVRKAMSMMRLNLADPIGTPTLADEIGVSRRHLEYRFRAATGTSVTKELRRLRLEEAKRLLQETPMRIHEIAYASGFPDLNRFGRYFREHFGQAPTEMRKAHLL